MKFTRIQLFKVPIDASYENVFDGWAAVGKTQIENMRSYRTFLYANYYYTSRLITLEKSKSIKVKDGRASLTLPYDYFDLRDYNYALFYDEQDTFIYAFFINSITSQNDGEAPSATLDIEWDVWSNNYHSMWVQDISANACNTLERHYDRFSNGTYNRKRFFADMKLPSPRSNPSTNNMLLVPQYHNFTTNAGITVDGNGVIPFWYVIVVNSPVYTPESALRGERQKSVFSFIYYPYGAWTASGMKPLYVLDAGGYVMRSYALPEHQGALFQDSTVFYGPQALIKKDKESYIEYCGITSSVPFNYYLNYIDANDSDYGVRTVMIKLPGENEGVSVENRIYASHADVTTGLSTNNVPIREKITNVPVIVPNEVTSSKVYSYSQYIEGDDEFSANTENLITKNAIISNSEECEVPFCHFPYKYKSAMLGSEEINLVTPYTNSYWQIRFNDTGLGIDGGVSRVAGEFQTVDFFNFQKPFGVLFGISQKSIFERNNAARYTLDNISSALSPVSNTAVEYGSDALSRKLGKNKPHKNTIAWRRGIISSGANAVINAVGALEKHEATMTDLARQKDTFKVPSVFDDINIKHLDFPFVYKHEYIEDNNIKADLWLCRTNGYLIDDYCDVLRNERIFYDFVRASDFSPFYITNNDDRDKLTEILQSGVRKWHINNFGRSAKYRDKVRNCNMAILNCEQKLIDTNYISWED